MEWDNRLFGSSGIRGVVGQELTLDSCREVAQAIGMVLEAGSRVCVATDTRVSREAIKTAIISGLCISGVDVIDLGILPTPALAFLTKDMGFDTGIMITASHNPPEYNGIKLFNSNGMGYSRVQEAEIERIYAEKAFRAGSLGNLQHEPGGKESYFRFMQDRFSKAGRNRLRIIVDPGNGAASGFASELFSLLGFNVLAINDEPDGLFPGRNPEPKGDTLTGTIEFLRAKNADLAVCFDGDADRVVFCDKEGFLGLNEMITFVSRLVVLKMGRKKVAATVETGRLLDLGLAGLGVEVTRGRVGDISVAYLTQELNAGIGVEPVGVYIMPEAGYYPDPFSATITLLSHIREASDIRAFLKEMPQLHSGQRKLHCPNYLKPQVINRISTNAELFDACSLNPLDGLRFEFGDSWMLIRASGTEPAIRVLAESNSKGETDELLDEGASAVKKAQGEVTG